MDKVGWKSEAVAQGYLNSIFKSHPGGAANILANSPYVMMTAEQYEAGSSNITSHFVRPNNK